MNIPCPALFSSVSLSEIMSSYMPIGDITVMALCIVMIMLLTQTFVKKDISFRFTVFMLIMSFTSAVANLILQMLISVPVTSVVPVYITRLVHYIALCFVPFVYNIYLQHPLRLNVNRNFYIISTAAVFVITTAIDVILTARGTGFRISSTGRAIFGVNVFSLIYAMFYGSIIYSLIKHRERLLKRVFLGIISVNIVSLFILFIQSVHSQNSFTNIACVLPVVGLVFVFHSNPYDTEIGTVSDIFFYSEHDTRIERGRDFILMSCILPGFSSAIKESNDLIFEFYGFMRRNTKNGVLYKFPNDRLLLSMPTDKECDRLINRMSEEFKELYEKYRLDYKLVVCRANKEITSSQDYIKLIEYAETSTSFTSTHIIDENDIKGFYDSDYILGELDDIVNSRNLDDPRVLVYCQPVYNILTRCYDTAEALMRLELPKTGMVFPDKFIPLAEQNNCIHTLSLIILNKTCKALKEILAQGYGIQRISINFSAIDLRYRSFCSEVKDIIASNDVPFDKIAVEITESRSESDFNLMKQKVVELREMGIKFYLDDFGTGYSNFERIMEIPFDIIKFDRSMLIESNRSESSEFMVKTFAGMFKQLNYSVLFEGVEDERDEKHCIDMQASYLQGYKYSRPIPIAKLCEFLDKK